MNKIMKNETKLAKVKKWLDENGIKYHVPQQDESWKSDLYLPDYKIHIKISTTEEVDRDFFEHAKRLLPVFIRTEETPKFIIEKLQNTIIKSMQRQQKWLLKNKEKEKKK